MLAIEENRPLAPLTTLDIGGKVWFFVKAMTEAQVAEAVKLAAAKGLDLFVLGGGSNVLVADTGFDGLVLQIGIENSPCEIADSGFQISDFKFQIMPDEARGPDSRLIIVGAGVNWDNFVTGCVRQNLAGVECLSGIPGFVGGTPVQNVGAYGQEVSETVVSVRCLDRTNGEFVTLTNAECGFTYRTSIFNSTERDRYIVLAVTFRLARNGPARIAYPELERAVEKPASLGEVREAVLRLRRAKSMVIDPDDPNSRSAGSFFKNPIVGHNRLDEIRASFENVPFFEFGENVKIPAAWLIEKAGFAKGFALGNAGISENHTLALINTGNATAAEIIRLKELIEAAVQAKFGIEMVPEPVFVGF